MKDLISVVIPTHNREKIILEAIQSVRKQTYSNFEIIVVDDGSTDRTRDLIAGLGDPRIHYVYQQNAGPAAARNTGIKKANGRYVGFLDSDDLWHPRKLEKQLDIMGKNGSVGLVSTWSQYLNFDGETLFVKKCRVGDMRNYIRFLLLFPDKAFTGTPTLLVRKECFEKAGDFDTGLSLFEDWDLCFRIGLLYDIRVVHEPLTYVRVDEQSYSSLSGDVRFRDMYFRYLDKAFGHKDLPREIISIKGKSYSHAYWAVGQRSLYKSGNIAMARDCFLKSLHHSARQIFRPGFMIAYLLSYLPPVFLKTYKKIRH